MAKVIINVTREGYSTDQVRSTLTIGELIEYLAQLKCVGFAAYQREELGFNENDEEYEE